RDQPGCRSAARPDSIRPLAAGGDPDRTGCPVAAPGLVQHCKYQRSPVLVGRTPRVGPLAARHNAPALAEILLGRAGHLLAAWGARRLDRRPRRGPDLVAL